MNQPGEYTLLRHWELLREAEIRRRTAPRGSPRRRRFRRHSARDATAA